MHEPGPINMSGFLSQQGLPLAKGQKLKLTANYENRYPHTRVMGIFGVYFAPDPAGDRRLRSVTRRSQSYASTAPGQARPAALQGAACAQAGRTRAQPAQAAGRSASATSSSSPSASGRGSGSTLRWKFEGSSLHDVTRRDRAARLLLAQHERRTRLPQEAEGARHLQALLHSPRDQDGPGDQGRAALRPSSSSLRIELLWWQGCPSWPQALEDLRAAVADAGLDPEEIEVTEITSSADAEAQGFVGSPTIRVDGRDLFPPGAGEPVGLSCRIYRLRDGRVSPTPEPADVRAAIARTVAG